MTTAISYGFFRDNSRLSVSRLCVILILSAAFLIAGAGLIRTAKAETLNIYSYRSPQLLQPLLDAYTDETGVSFRVLQLKKGMAQRLEAEGENTEADIALTVDISRLSELDNLGLLAAVDSKILNKNIPEHLRDPDSKWFALSTRARVAVVSVDRVDTSKLKRIEDLADKHWQGRVCTRKGSHAYNRSLLASIIAHNGQASAQEWAAALVANMSRKPQGNDRAQANAIYSGQCDVALMNTYYYGLMSNNMDKIEQQEWAKATRIVFLNQGDGDRGQHVNISGAGILETSKNYDAAVAFLEWLSEPKAQRIYSSTNYEYPVNPAVEPDDEIKSWGSFRADSLFVEDLSDAAPAAQRIINIVGW
ncbi:extracellular solute-binding protein [Alphaproteobacteria bacterium]|nr:extracellular solute-binding protein [Alphaproteobacteria bacterium]